MFSRKSLFVALTVLAMLAMLVPVAMAAPEVVSAVAITSPTTLNPALIRTPDVDNPDTEDVVEGLPVNYVLTITGTQVNDVVVTATLLNDYGATFATASQILQAAKLHTGANPKTIVMQVPALADGWYNLRICAVERNENGGVIGDPCTTQTHAVRVDNTLPTATLERPAEAPGCTWVTGQAYELFGMATDNVEVSRAWFEFSPTANLDDVIQIGNENAANVAQDATPVPGFPGEYTALWDSSQLPDGSGSVRFCAEDTAGNTYCSDLNPEGWADVCIENHVKISLQKGWNLISTPLMLYNSAVSDVLTRVWNPGTGQFWPTAPIDQIVTTRDGGATWTSWMAGAPATLTTIEDGYGYWVHSVAPATIEFAGTWLSIGPNAPPEYPVHEGWNLIGYTHFGTPTDINFAGAACPTLGPCWGKLVSEYLGFPMMVSVESMYRYDAAHGYYIPVDEMTGEQRMLAGAGYWLALAEGTEGTINP